MSDRRAWCAARSRHTLLALVVLGSCAEREATSPSLLDPPLVVSGDVAGEGVVYRPWGEGGWPPDVVSLTVTVSSPDPGAVLTLGLREGAGRWLTDPNRPELSLQRTLRGRGMTSALWPVAGEGWPPVAGLEIWARRLDGETNRGPVNLTIWTKRADGQPPARQALSLALFLVGAVPDDHRLARALGEVGRIWRQGDIEVREPMRLRVSAAEAGGLERLQIDPRLGSDSPQLGELMRLSTRAPAGTLAIFVVEDIAVGPGQGIWALSAGVPVPPVGGTIRSGIAASAALLAHDPVRAGQVMAHEIGHALGLFHTTEAALAAGDPGGPSTSYHDGLHDTPACPAAADLDGDRTLTARECERHDAANLMFWTAGFDGTTLTPEQARIARGSALVR